MFNLALDFILVRFNSICITNVQSPFLELLQGSINKINPCLTTQATPLSAIFRYPFYGQTPRLTWNSLFQVHDYDICQTDNK